MLSSYERSDNGSKIWMITVRIIVIILGILQTIIIGWIKFISQETINSKVDIGSIKTSVGSIEKDVSYLRGKIDDIYNYKRKN